MRTIICAILVIWFTTTTSWAEHLGNVWPLGDEITSGTIPGGYRDPLYQKWAAAGQTFQFVGKLTNFSTPTLDAAGQQHHDGYANMAILGVDWYYPDMLAEMPRPDKVLLLVGTYDFTMFHSPQDQAEAINRLDTLLSHLTATLPNATFYVGNLLPRADPYYETQIQTLFNPLVPDVAARHGAVAVDLHSALTLADLADGLHPNALGYEKLAQAWYGAVVPEPSTSTLIMTLLLCAALLWRGRSR